MSLDNNSANNFKDFLDAIKPYLNYQPVDLSCMGIDAFQFSTDEKPVGMWTDRKILYAKTVDCGALPNNTSKSVSSGLTNVDIKLIFGHAKNPTSGYTIPLNHATFDGGAVSVYYNYSNNNIVVKDYENKTAFTESYVTLFYTKTTDSPLASDEKFAGVTSGGEVIYERTVSITTARNVTTNSWNVIGEADSWFGSVDQIMSGSVKRNNDCASMPCEFNKDNGHLRIDPWRNDYFNTQTKITVRYTKTP